MDGYAHVERERRMSLECLLGGKSFFCFFFIRCLASKLICNLPDFNADTGERLNCLQEAASGVTKAFDDPGGFTSYRLVAAIVILKQAIRAIKKKDEGAIKKKDEIEGPSKR
jgi:hypothetical protein